LFLPLLFASKAFEHDIVLKGNHKQILVLQNTLRINSQSNIFHEFENNLNVGRKAIHQNQ
jgi:hypothetical protein